MEALVMLLCNTVHDTIDSYDLQSKQAQNSNLTKEAKQIIDPLSVIKAGGRIKDIILS